jgi:Chaperone required for the assembly of the mitochondrial F1-ATPase
MRRFWTEVTIVPESGGFALRLDGKPMRLPASGALTIPHRPLADAMAAEWRDAPPVIGPADLPLTRLATAATSQIAPDPAPLSANLLAYGRTDLLCYRADAPDSLIALQHAQWQPWLDWAAARFAARLETTHGIVAITQPEEAIRALARVLATQDHWALAGLGVAVPALGSLILGLAAITGALTASEAHDLARLDEDWQERQWGTDAESTARRALVARDIASAVSFVNLTRA